MTAFEPTDIVGDDDLDVPTDGPRQDIPPDWNEEADRVIEHGSGGGLRIWMVSLRGPRLSQSNAYIASGDGFPSVRLTSKVYLFVAPVYQQAARREEEVVAIDEGAWIGGIGRPCIG